jgi:uncharacterized protein (DUF58 family)
VNGKAALLLSLVYGLLFAALAARSGAVAWMAAPLLTTLLWSLVRTPRPEAVRLSAVRRVERSRQGRVEVTVAVRNGGTSPLHLQLADALHPPVEVEGSTEARTVLGAGRETVLRYSFCVPRGRFAWKGVRAVAGDPLGLIEERFDLEAAGEVHVLPEPVRFRPLPLRPDRTLPSPGSIPARVGGGGTEFFGIREYQVGDALRWIDWRRTARHRGKLFTKQFEQEQIADVGLVLDGRSSVEEDGAPSLLEHNVRAAASLAATFLRQGNRVSLLVLGETDARVFPGAGRVQLQRILSCLAGFRTQHQRPLQDSGHSFVRMFPARSILVALIPLLPDDLPLLRRLRAHGRQVVLVSADPYALGAVAAPGDEVGRLALRAGRVERRLGLRAAAQLRIPVVDWKVTDPLYPLIRAALRPGRGGHVP